MFPFRCVITAAVPAVACSFTIISAAEPGSRALPAPGTAENQRALPAAQSLEQQMESGVRLLATLYYTMAGVRDSVSARAAVPEVVRIIHELQVWTQTINSTPPPQQEELARIERKYIPGIERINNFLEVQGERLAAANYYGSDDLMVALYSLLNSAQQ